MAGHTTPPYRECGHCGETYPGYLTDNVDGDLGLGLDSTMESGVSRVLRVSRNLDPII